MRCTPASRWPPPTSNAKSKMKPFVLALLLLLAGCASEPRNSCELESPPDSSQIRATHGVDIASFPAVVPRGFTGCQRRWVGDQRERRRMQLIATTYYESGRVFRFAGQEPGGPAYDCRYSGGTLDTQGSLNAVRCPLLSELEGRD